MRTGWYSKLSDSPVLNQPAASKETHRKVIVPPVAYDVDGIVSNLSYKSKLPPLLASHFVELDADSATRTFLQDCLDKYGRCSIKAWCIITARSFLGLFMSHTDAIATLGCGLMHIISAQQLSTLLRASYNTPALDVSTFMTNNFSLRSPLSPLPTLASGPVTKTFTPYTALKASSNVTELDGLLVNAASRENVTYGSSEAPVGSAVNTSTTAPMEKLGVCLDIGAGSGRMAQLLAPLFSRVECTEVSLPMVKAIRDKGFVAYHTADITTLPADSKYDVIGLFNLIDRCSKPITLLNDLKDRLRDENSRLVIAVPLPLRPAVESSDGWKTPEEYIAPPGCYCGYTWEESVKRLIVDVIDPIYDVRVISRLPYLSEGNLKRPYYVLDDVLLVLSKKKE